MRFSWAARKHGCAAGRFDLGHGAFQVGAGRRLVVPFEIVLHEGDALAFHGMSDESGRASGSERRRAESRGDGLEVVAVDLGGGPAEGFPLAGEWLEKAVGAVHGGP